MPTTGPKDVRNLEAGTLLLGVGAVLLFISLFLEWYQPNVTAWEIFEVWDLVLALLAAGAIFALASRFGYGAPRPASHVFGPGIAALVIVLFAILDPPPLTSGIDGDPGTGLWLALAATVLMALGALLSVARVSVAFTRGPGAAPGPIVAPPAADPAAPGPYGAHADVRDPAVAPGAVPPAGPADPAAGPARRGRRFMRGGDARVDPAEPPPSTEPTRRM